MGKHTAQMSNYEIALKAEAKKVVRCFQAYDHEQRANHQASFRLGYQQRNSVGEYFYVHPDLPGKAYPKRMGAARAALAEAEGR